MNVRILLLLNLAALTGIGSAHQRPGPQLDGRYLLNNGWSLSPAGKTVVLNGIAAAMDIAPVNGTIAVLVDQVWNVRVELHSLDGREESSVVLPDGGACLRWYSPSRLLVAGGRTGNIYILDVVNSHVIITDSLSVAARGTATVEGLDHDRDFVYAGVDSALVIASIEQHKIIRRIPLEGLCRAVLRRSTSRSVYATLWNSMTVAEINLDSMKIVHHVHVAGHPCAIIERGHAGPLFVACANDGMVMELDPTDLHITHVLTTAPFSGPRAGSMPSALTLTPNGQYLFVANTGNNALVVYDVQDPDRMSVIGWIPTGRSPMAVAMHGKEIIVANAYGIGSASVDAEKRTTSSALHGTLSLITAPNAVELHGYTQTVLGNIPYYAKDRVDHCPNTPIPDTGLSSPIKHVFLVVKDGRSYDEIFGDLLTGDGDSSLCRFPDSVTPNHHALAREFTVCDNVFSDAIVHEEARQWMLGAFATDVVRERWPAYRGGRGQPPWIFSGESALTSPTIGYIWDYSDWKRVRVRIYGEFTETRSDSLSYAAHGIEDNFSGMVCQSYPSYDVVRADTARITTWEHELATFETHKRLPDLTVIRLANDGYAGSAERKAQAIMADNDLALGRLVARISQSPFWNQSAIVVVESDAEQGMDHVDPHRIPVLLISPMVRRGFVDTTMYTTTSVLKTIERILGLPSMSQFDESAKLMCEPFQLSRNAEPYHVRTPRIGRQEQRPGN